MRRFVKIGLVQAIVCCIFSMFDTSFSFAVSEKEPIKATQSNAVAVTKELLTREGDAGPASPTMEMKDTSKFLVKKPYEKAEEKMELEAPGKAKSWWEKWFFWLDEEDEEQVFETG